MADLEIRLGKGVGPVSFGMTASEIKPLLGAEWVWEPWMRGNRNGCLLYPSMIMSFDQHTSEDEPPPDARLEEIEILLQEGAWLSEAVLLGRSVGQWNKQQLVRYLREDNVDFEVLPNGCLRSSYFVLGFGIETDQLSNDAPLNYIITWPKES